jgi:hypothetical protein
VLLLLMIMPEGWDMPWLYIFLFHRRSLNERLG